MNTNGIDVDSRFLVCRIWRSGKNHPEAHFSNDAAGHRKLMSWATRGHKPARVCMEATGVYSVPLAMALHADGRFEVMEAMELTVRALIEVIPELSKKLEPLESVTGIATKTGPRILAELEVLPDDMTGSQWVTYAGLDPRPYESGSSTNKPRRISKNGNRYLREALYFPALVASKNEPHVKAYYDKRIARGKKPMQVIVAIMRKLLLVIWGMYKNGERWNGEKFYKTA